MIFLVNPLILFRLYSIKIAFYHVLLALYTINIT